MTCIEGLGFSHLQIAIYEPPTPQQEVNEYLERTTLDPHLKNDPNEVLRAAITDGERDVVQSLSLVYSFDESAFGFVLSGLLVAKKNGKEILEDLLQSYPTLSSHLDEAVMEFTRSGRKDLIDVLLLHGQISERVRWMAVLCCVTTGNCELRAVFDQGKAIPDEFRKKMSIDPTTQPDCQMYAQFQSAPGAFIMFAILPGNLQAVKDFIL